MNWPLLVGGAAVIAVVMYDVVLTTLSVGNPSGPVTGRLARGLWAVGLRTRRAGLLQALGIGLMLLIVVTWLLGLWAGWAMVFNAAPAAVVDSTTGRVAGAWERIYFAGYTLFTLGNGEFRPDGTPWQLLTVVALLNGLALASLSITYLVPVTAAALERRQLAATIAAMGERPDTALVRAWDGTGFGMLQHHLMSLGPQLALLTQRHLGYPVLHYFHSSDRKTAAAPMIAVLDELLTVLQFGVAEQARPPASVTEPFRAELTQFLDTLRSAFISPADAAPAIPALHRLREAGVPTVADEVFAQRLGEIAERRRLLVALVNNDGWDWAGVWTGSDESDRQRPKTADDEADEDDQRQTEEWR